MDYSLLVGIHFKYISPDGDLVPSGSPTPAGNYLIQYEVVYNLKHQSLYICLCMCMCLCSPTTS